MASLALSKEETLMKHDSLKLENLIFSFVTSLVFPGRFSWGFSSVVKCHKVCACCTKLDFVCSILEDLGLLFAPMRVRLNDVRLMMHLIVTTLNKFQDWAAILHFY